MYTGTVLEYDEFSGEAEVIVLTDCGEEIIVPVVVSQFCCFGDVIPVSEEQVRGAITGREMEEQFSPYWEKDYDFQADY